MGLIVNPVAGMGGRVGLKGTDGVHQKAVALGAKPVSPYKAREFLQRFKELELDATVDIVTCPGVMGEDIVRSLDLETQTLPMAFEGETTTEDTRLAVRLLVAAKVDLIVFVGGDGTARDVFDTMHAISSSVPVLGVPSGVKMYSSIFAATSRDAASVVHAFAEGSAQIMEFEIMDADEKEIRGGRFSVRLYGLLQGPFISMRLLGSKQISPETIDEHENQVAAARFVVEEMDPEATYILGPGSTVKCVADLLGVEKTLLGVDIYRNKKVIKDVNEQSILDEIKDWKNTWVVVSPIGRQGMLLGRGNQQISPEVIRKVGKKRIVVVATRSKIQGIEGRVLRVDTGDPKVDQMLRGYIKVVIDYREWRLVQVL